MHISVRRTFSMLGALISISAFSACSSACAVPSAEMPDGGLRLSVDAGPEWIHEFPILGPIVKPNEPTFALWLTDEAGGYLDTLFVTRKAGKAAWVSADDGRPEALPLFFHARGGQPSAEHPAPDGVTGASPKNGLELVFVPKNLPNRFYVYGEFNHSVDYNGAYPEGVTDASAANYSGGKGGSGQPAVVYRALIDSETDRGSEVALELVGHSEPGAPGNGTIYGDLSGLTGAVRIVRSIKVALR